ncbi:MAG: ABC transporter ATP-binding protein [Thermoleophilaceae bacterium]
MRSRSLLRLFSGARGTVILTLAVSIVQAALLVPVALLIKHVFDTQLPHGDRGGVVVSGLAILGLYLLTAALGLFTRWSVLRVTKAAITRLRGDLLQQIYALPRAYFDRESLGKLHSTIVQDSERLDVLANASAGVLPPAIAVAVGLCVILAVLNALLFAVLLAVVPVLMLIGRWLGRAVRRRTRRWQDAFDVFSSQTQLSLRAMSLTKVQGSAATELEERRREHSELGRAGLAMAWASGAYGIVQGAVSASAGVVVLIVGGRAVASGDMSLGSLISFYAILALLLRQVTTIVSTVPDVVSGSEYMARLERILETDEHEPYRGTRAISLQRSLELDRVSFGYGAEPLLHDVSLPIERGRRVALFGPNGAGKSTLVSLLLGLYRPQHGTVRADGIAYDELDMTALRRGIGVILQDPIIFPRTIAENIAYGHPDATRDDVVRAARASTAAAFIEALPDGYDAHVGDDGGLLSGGQRQRIAIARALVARPSVLILDEPTTHLDDTSIGELMANLEALPGAPAVLTISHDAEVARHADAVYHLRDGRILHTDMHDRGKLAVAAGGGA